MQTEESIQSNGGSIVTSITQGVERGPKPYYFDKTPLTQDIPWGNGVTLRITYEKPQDKDHDDYEATVERKQETANGETVSKTKPEAANCEFFDRLVIQADKFRPGETEPFETWDRDKCLLLPDEVKTDIIVGMGRFEFELVGGEDDSLLFSTGNWKIRQFAGNTNKPDVEIFYELKPLGKTQRADYKDGLESKDRTIKKKIITTTETTFQKKARKHFAANFVGVEGGQLERGVYDSAMKDDYLKQIDSSFKLLVIDTMVSYYRRARD